MPSSAGHREQADRLDALPPALWSVLRASQDAGAIGAATDLRQHVAHALGFVDSWLATDSTPPHRVLDLGSGGGLPGLVIACVWPSCTMLLVDATLQRIVALQAAVVALGMADRVEAIHGRAEDLARDPAYRGRVDLVVARSFGSPAITAECASGFLVAGGRVVVSEPPDVDGATDRWAHPDALAELGLARSGSPGIGGFEVLVQETPTPDRFPRRAGIPKKRPLF